MRGSVLASSDGNSTSEQGGVDQKHVFSLCTEDGYALDMKCENASAKAAWENLIQREIDRLVYLQDLVAARKDKTRSKAAGRWTR